MPISLPSICNAVMPVRAVNHYRINVKKDQRIIVDCAARGMDSKLHPVVMIADSAGRDLLVNDVEICWTSPHLKMMTT